MYLSTLFIVHDRIPTWSANSVSTVHLSLRKDEHDVPLKLVHSRDLLILDLGTYSLESHRSLDHIRVPRRVALEVISNCPMYPQGHSLLSQDS